VRSFPFPQRKSVAAQYLSQPQQMRSGWAGYFGIRLTMSYRYARQRHSVVLDSLNRNTCFPKRLWPSTTLLLPTVAGRPTAVIHIGQVDFR
jgi:hypothetical protein